jgi:hypothetical protein
VKNLEFMQGFTANSIHAVNQNAIARLNTLSKNGRLKKLGPMDIRDTARPVILSHRIGWNRNEHKHNEQEMKKRVSIGYRVEFELGANWLWSGCMEFKTIAKAKKYIETHRGEIQGDTYRIVKVKKEISKVYECN